MITNTRLLDLLRALNEISFMMHHLEKPGERLACQDAIYIIDHLRQRSEISVEELVLPNDMAVYAVPAEPIPCLEQLKEEALSPKQKKGDSDQKNLRKSILEEAIYCVCNDRNAEYGEPEDNFRIIADFWSRYLEKEITAHDVGMMMALFKMVRIMSGGIKEDNYIDACGYLSCAGEIACRAKECTDGNRT